MHLCESAYDNDDDEDSQQETSAAVGQLDVSTISITKCISRSVVVLGALSSESTN